MRVRMSPGSTRTAETPLVAQFAGERPREELERGFARAVRAPAGVGAVCRVAGDVDDEAVTRCSSGTASWIERERRADIDREDAAEALDVEVDQRTDSAEFRRVVDQHVETAKLASGVDPAAGATSIRDVAGNRHDAGRRCRASRSRARPSAAASRAPMTRS